MYENERGTYIFNSKDLCMIEHIPELVEAVGVTGFEPATTWSQTRCATGLRYAPIPTLQNYNIFFISTKKATFVVYFSANKR